MRPLSMEELGELLRGREPPAALRKFGRYLIVGAWEEGSFGWVALATREMIGGKFALKVLKGKSAHGSDDWLREGKIALQVEHDNLIKVRDADVEDGWRYLVMEWMNGGSLRASMESGKPLAPPRTVADLMMRIARAVAHLHEEGFVHCDLKPDNIMAPAGDSPNRFQYVKVVDFGLAGSKYQTDVVFGTPQYCPPRDFPPDNSPTDISPRDVFALGMVLHECLTGTLPDPANPAVSIADPTLAAICAKCLSGAAKDRFTARKLADDLLAYLEFRPTKARPLNVVQRTALWLRGNWKVASIAGALVVLGAVALVGVASSAYLNQQRVLESNQRQLEKEQRDRKDAEVLAQRLREDARNQYRQRIQAYAIKIKSAQEWIGRNNYKRALAELNGCDNDLRGWEWHYLNQLCHGSAWSHEFKKGIQSLVFSGDGKELAVAVEGEIHVGPFQKDWAKQPPFKENFAGRRIRQMVLTPDWLVTASTAPLENVATGVIEFHARREGQPKRDTIRDNFLLRQGENTLPATTRLALHLDGKTLVASTVQHRLRVLDLADPRSQSFFGADQIKYETLGLAFSSDGRTLATVHGGDKGGQILLWDWESKKVVFSHPDLHQIGVAIAPSNNEVITFSATLITFWKRESDNWQQDIARPPKSAKNRGVLAWHPTKANLIAYADGDEGELFLQDLNPPSELYQLRGHVGKITALAFDPTGKWLATGDTEGTVHVWQTTDLNQKPPLPGLTARSATSPDGKLRSEIVGDHTVRWTVDAEEPRSVSSRKKVDGISVPDSTRIVVSLEGAERLIIEAKTAEVLLTLK